MIVRYLMTSSKNAYIECFIFMPNRFSWHDLYACKVSRSYSSTSCCYWQDFPFQQDVVKKEKACQWLFSICVASFLNTK